MERVIRDIEEARRLSVINIQKSTQKIEDIRCTNFIIDKSSRFLSIAI